MPRSPFVRFFLYVLFSAVVVVGGYSLATGRWKLPTNVAREPDHDEHPSAEFVPPPMSGMQSTVPSGPLEPDPKTLPIPRPGLPDPPTIAAETSKLPGANLPPLQAEAPESKELPNVRLVSPIEGMKASDLHDMFNDARSGHSHRAIDIMEPRGTPVHAVVEGNVVKLFTSKYGGLTVYEFDNAGKYCYYYAHLDRYAPDLKEGTLLRAGAVLGYVGSTGDANPAAPHLHFAIFQLGPAKHWHEGNPVNPYSLLKQIAPR